MLFLLSSLSHHLSLLLLCWGFPGGSIYLPVQETWVWSLGWGGPLEKGMATHSSSLAWRNPMDRRAWQATVYGVTKTGQDWTTNTSTFLLCWPLISPSSIPIPACGLCSGTFLHMEYTPPLTLVPQSLPSPKTEHLFIYLFHIDTYLSKSMIY